MLEASEHPPPTVSLRGDLDYFNIGQVREALEPVRGSTIIDLTGAHRLDAAAMTELVRAAKRAAPHDVVLVVPSPNIRRLLRFVAFNRLFRIVEHLDDA
jgi:anti-anti-sigma factor